MVRSKVLLFMLLSLIGCGEWGRQVMNANQYCNFSGSECVLEVLEEAYNNRNTDNRDVPEPISPYVLLNLPLDLVIAQATKSEVEDYRNESSVDNGGPRNDAGSSFQYDEQWILYLADQMVTARLHRGIYSDEEANDWVDEINQARQIVNGRIIEAAQREFDSASQRRRLDQERFEADLEGDAGLARSLGLETPAGASAASRRGQEESEQANSIGQDLSDIENIDETDVTNAADDTFDDYDGPGEILGPDCSLVENSSIC